jgi:hypothetical protein
MIDRLDVALLHRRFDQHPRDLYSIDFLVNDTSLCSATRANERGMAGCFMSLAVPGHTAKLAKIFAGELLADVLPGDRIPLFVCPICGDAGCGTISFKLTHQGKLVRWSEFAYENTWDDEVTDFESYSTLGPFEFDLEPYERAIGRAVKLVSAGAPIR